MCKVLDAMEKKGKQKILNSLVNILKAIAFIENNERDLYVREVSMKVYGDSKFFEQMTLQPVRQLLRKQTGKELTENELLDEILQQYHIYKEYLNKGQLHGRQQYS